MGRPKLLLGLKRQYFVYNFLVGNKLVTVRSESYFDALKYVLEQFPNELVRRAKCSA